MQVLLEHPLPRPRVVGSQTRGLRRPEPAWLPCLTGPAVLPRDFRIEDGKAVIPLGTAVQGDVLIVIYHARSTLGGRLQAKVSAPAGSFLLVPRSARRPHRVGARGAAFGRVRSRPRGCAGSRVPGRV